MFIKQRHVCSTYGTREGNKTKLDTNPTTLKIEAVCCFETSVNFYQTALRHVFKLFVQPCNRGFIFEERSHKAQLEATEVTRSIISDVTYSALLVK
jgi:hypothetical protein